MTEQGTIQQARVYTLARPDTIRGWRDNEKVVTVLAQAFPGDATTGERQARAIRLLTEAAVHIENSQCASQLLACTQPSVIQAISEVAYLDLSLHKTLGEAYLIPFRNVCTLMTGYKGFVKLMVNTGIVSNLESVLVYKGEAFRWWRDEKGPHWEHAPDMAMQGRDDQIAGAYAVGYLPGGGVMMEVMNIAQLEKIRKSSKSSNSPAYSQWLGQMYRKAPIRRLQNYIPKTGDNEAVKRLTKAVEWEDRDFGLESEKAKTALRETGRELRQTATAPLPATEAPGQRQTDDDPPPPEN